MKTNQNLTRKMGDFDVIQRTQDCMFNATTLLKQWNEHSGQQKQIVHYFDQSTTKEFIETIKTREFTDNGIPFSADYDGVYKKTKGGKDRGSTWMHPILFIDFAMWINPSFKYDVIKFVYDELIHYRNEAGDAYKEMSSAVAKIVPNSFLPVAIQKIAQALNFIVYNQHETEIRNKQAEESKVRELSELEKDIAKLVDGKFIKTFDHLIAYLRKKWSDKYVPKVLTA